MTHNNFIYHYIINTSIVNCKAKGFELTKTLRDNVLTLSISKEQDFSKKELFRIIVDFNSKNIKTSVIHIDNSFESINFAKELCTKFNWQIAKVLNGYKMSEWDICKSNLKIGLYSTPSTISFDDINRGNYPLMESVDKQRIFFDMDGILAEFNKNATMEEVFSDGYFETLKPMQGSIDLYKKLQESGYDCYILSKARGDKVVEKIEWLKHYMPFVNPENVIFVPLEADKSKFIYAINEKDVLIDDYNPNLKEWKGIAVKGLNGINTATDRFYCTDLSFYKLYENCGNEQEIQCRLNTCVKEIKAYITNEPNLYKSVFIDEDQKNIQNYIDHLKMNGYKFKPIYDEMEEFLIGVEIFEDEFDDAVAIIEDWNLSFNANDFELFDDKEM